MTTEAKFKVGDRVRCRDQGEHQRIANGECYVVATTSPGNFLTLEGNEIGVYSFARFELLPATVTTAPVEGGKRKPCTLPGGSHSIDHRSESCTYCGMSAENVLAQEEYIDRQNGAQPDPYATERTGPYGGSDLGHEQVVAALTLRDAKVKVLRAEMGREPMRPRFPPEGRSERALPRTNGR